MVYMWSKYEVVGVRIPSLPKHLGGKVRSRGFGPDPLTESNGPYQGRALKTT